MTLNEALLIWVQKDYPTAYEARVSLTLEDVDWSYNSFGNDPEKELKHTVYFRARGVKDNSIDIEYFELLNDLLQIASSQGEK